MWKFASLAACAVVLTASVAALGEEQSAAPPAPEAPHDMAAYTAFSKLPDFSGAWLADKTPTQATINADIPLKPKYATQLAKLKASAKGNTKPKRDRFCRPLGLPLTASHVGPLMEILYAPGHIFINTEAMEGRDIHTDGRKLPVESQIDGFAGYSVGRWEGDTLIIDSIGFLADIDLVPGIINAGDLRLSERIHLVGPDKLEDQITLSGAKALDKPYSYSVTYTRHREWQAAEYICLTESHTDYKVEGYKPTAAQLIASTDRKPPVRQPAPGKIATQADWEALAKLPDWYGFWNFDQAPNELVTAEYIPVPPPREKYLKYLYGIRDVGGDTPSDVYHCRPRGAAQMMKAAGAGFFWVFTPGQVTMVPNNSQVRRYYTDGRPVPKKLELSFNGFSTAHWEGDTLVAETVGLRPDIQMFYGMPSGDNLRLVERIRTIAPNKTEFAVTQYSDVALTKPWSYRRTFTRHRDWDMLEDYCAQNNRDVGTDTGMQIFDLTPPPEISDGN